MGNSRLTVFDVIDSDPNVSLSHVSARTRSKGAGRTSEGGGTSLAAPP